MDSTPLPQILFEDSDVVVVNKPAGWLSHASVDRRRPDVLTFLRKRSEETGHKESLVLLHRLDRDTSGVLLFSRNSALHEKWAELFKQREVQKIYWGITDRKPHKQKWTVTNHLGLEKKPASKTPRTIAVQSGGDPATTDFQVLRQQNQFHLIEARPHSGRRHQIRTHLQLSRCPLVGDPLYGGSPGSRVLLHAERLILPHPETKVLCEWSAPAPDDFFVP